MTATLPNYIIDKAFRPDNKILIRISGSFVLILEGVISGRKVQKFIRTKYAGSHRNSRARFRHAKYDVATTMIYTHVLQQGGQGVASPLDDLGT